MASTDEVRTSHVVLTPRQVFIHSCGLMAVIFTILLPVFAAPVAAIATRSTRGVVIGVVVLILLVGLEVVGWTSIYKRYRGATHPLPTLDATPTELCVSGGGYPTQTIDRRDLASVVRLTSNTITGTGLQFRDAHAHQLGVWDVGWLATPILDWLVSLGYETSSLQGQAAIDALTSHDTPHD